MDHDQTNRPTKNIIAAAKLNGVERVVETSLLGLYNEVPGEFEEWNRDYGGTDRSTAGGVWFNLYPLRLPWLNDRPEVNYTLTHRHDQFVGVSGSRRSIADPSLGTNDSLGIDDPTTEGATRPVY